jgi:hypothetical protein
MVAAARKGDDALLREVVAAYEEAGFQVVGADRLLAALLAPEGALGTLSPGERDWRDIRRAAAVVASLGVLDIGQGAVVCDGLVLAVEAQEGTDEMLRRCARLPAELRGGPDRRCGVLVKRPKPQQERRIDLPVIGVETVRLSAAAGLAGVAVEAGAALVLDRAAVAAEADALGVFVLGAAPGDLA